MENESGVVTETMPIETAAVATPEQIEFATNMAMAFDEPMPTFDNQNAPTDTVDTQTEIVSDPNQETETPSSIDYLKELGFETIDSAKAEVESLRKLRDTPLTKKDIEFKDEQSKKIHELIRNGEYKPVKKYLEAQELMENLDTMGKEDKLKLYIKMQNPKFDNELIEDEYQSLYSIDEDEILDPMKLRKEKLRLEQRIENDVTKAAEYFTEYAKKVELPNIASQETTTNDENYEAYKASIAQVSEFQEKVIVPSVMALTEEKVKINVNVNDANNKMQFGLSITPDKADLDAAKQSVIDFNEFIRNSFYDKDGTFLEAEAAQFVLKNKNFDKYAQSLARQAVNAERKRVVETEKGTNGVQRDMNIITEKTELQRQMEFALS